MFEDALAAGICSMGVDVLQVGPMPTPGMAFLTADMRCDAGVMISASHNPYQDNGIKFFSRDGFKLPDEIEAAHRGADRHRRARVAARAGRRRSAARSASTTPTAATSSSSRRPSRRSSRSTGCASCSTARTAPPTRSGRPCSRSSAPRSSRSASSRTARNINDGVRLAVSREAGREGARAARRRRHRARRRRRPLRDGRREGRRRRRRRAARALRRATWSSAARCGAARSSRTVMSNLGLETRARAAAASGWCARRSATATSSRRCAPAATTSAASSPATCSSSTTTPPATASSPRSRCSRSCAAAGGRSPSWSRDFERFPQVLVNVRVAEKRPLESLPELSQAARREGRDGARRPRPRADPLQRHRAEGARDGRRRRRGAASASTRDELAERAARAPSAGRVVMRALVARRSTPLPRLRDVAGRARAATSPRPRRAAELAGVDAVRLGANEALRPCARRTCATRAASCAASSCALAAGAVAAQARARGAPRSRRAGARGRDGSRARGPARPARRAPALAPARARAARGGHPGVARWIAPELEAVKLARGAERRAASSSTPARSSTCPVASARAALERFGDAARLAAKLRLADRRRRRRSATARLREAARRPRRSSSASWSAARLVARALLVGLDRALRELRSALA